METKTETSIVKRTENPLAGFRAVEWTRERVDLIKRTVCPKNTTDDEFLLFIEQCKRTDLDPLLKEAFCIDRAGQRVFQPSHEGMMARADRFDDFEGIECAAVYTADRITISDTEVAHSFNPAAPRGALVGAWARVHRRGRVLPIEWVLLSEYVQANNPKWKPQGGQQQTMICKVARVAALRRAYPNVFGSSYIAEEWADEKDVTPLPENHATQTLAQKVEAKRAAINGAPVDAAPAPHASPPAVGTIRTGKGKGTLIASLTASELEARITTTAAGIEKAPAAAWVPAAQADLDDLRAELERRIDAGPPKASPPKTRRLAITDETGAQVSGPVEPGAEG